MVAASGWYRRQALRTIRTLIDPRWETVLAVSPDREGLQSRVWPEGIARWAQGRGDLGARMGGVLRGAPAGPVAIIGSDIPGISRADIA
ncbi:MAG: DUF2064 domain-containing protein, partial [Pseudomonadota bacterium]